MKQSILFSIVFCGSLLLLSAIMTGCKKECSINQANKNTIIVNAGNSQFVKVTADTVNLTATLLSGNPKTYSWTTLSGPNVPVIVHSDSLNALVTGLISGTYVFQLKGISPSSVGFDTTSVVVAHTLILQPSDNPNEGVLNSYYATGSGVGVLQFSAAAWTHSGPSELNRGIIKFDFPLNNKLLTSATLFLYSTLTPVYYNGASNESNQGTANACYIRRISSFWDSSTVSWNNQPLTVTNNEVSIPQSISVNQDLAIDVTSLVTDMLNTNTNYGFEMLLQNETPYNARQFYSSYYSDATVHPKLVLHFQ